MPTDLGAVQARAEQAKKEADRGSYEYFEWKEGPNKIRLLPACGARTVPHAEIKIAYNVGPNKRSVVPPTQFGIKPDPLAERIAALHGAGDPASKEEADKMNPKNRVLYWVIDRNDEASGPELLNINHNVFRDILAIFSDPDYKDISHQDSGTDLTINYTPGNKTKNGFPDWQVMPRRDRSPLGTPEQIAEWTAVDLFEKYHVLQPSEAPYILACLAGTEQEYLKSLRDAAAPAAGTTSPAAESTPAIDAAAKLFDAKFWWNNNGNAQLITGAELHAMIVGGHKPEDIQVMTEDQSSGWTTAKGVGF